MGINSNKILIIGGPNAGKTHFGGQLYGRLISRTEMYKITSPPEDISIFQEVLDDLNQGRSSGHTQVTAHKTLELELEDNLGSKSVLSFPDYGGEQIKAIVNDRRITSVWKEQIDDSNSWMLFIRPDELLATDDLVSRGLPDQEVLKNRNNKSDPMKLSESAFYIELLQMLLFVKKVDIKQRIKDPKLIVVLSCWDILNEEEKNSLPTQVLLNKLPALYSFITSIWESYSHQVIGLSSTERSLSTKDSDKEYVKRGPESFGYFITNTGKKETDLTKIISTFIG